MSAMEDLSQCELLCKPCAYVVHVHVFNVELFSSSERACVMMDAWLEWGVLYVGIHHYTIYTF